MTVDETKGKANSMKFMAHLINRERGSEIEEEEIGEQLSRVQDMK